MCVQCTWYILFEHDFHCNGWLSFFKEKKLLSLLYFVKKWIRCRLRGMHSPLYLYVNCIAKISTIYTHKMLCILREWIFGMEWILYEDFKCTRSTQFNAFADTRTSSTFRFLCAILFRLIWNCCTHFEVHFIENCIHDRRTNLFYWNNVGRWMCLRVCVRVHVLLKSQGKNTEEKTTNKKYRMRIVTRQNCMAINITERVAEAWTSVNRIRLCAR